MNFGQDYIDKVLNGEFFPCPCYRISDDGLTLVKKTEEEIFSQDDSVLENNSEIRYYCKQKISELENYLSETDFVITKLNEARIEYDEELETQLREKYSNELIERKNARKKINFLQEKMDSLQPLKPLIEARNKENN